jgi:hypothetical protein
MFRTWVTDNVVTALQLAAPAVSQIDLCRLSAVDRATDVLLYNRGVVGCWWRL